MSSLEQGSREQGLRWFASGEGHMVEVVNGLSDLDAATLLPEWDRRHLVSHLIGNAEALGNLVHWARTGQVTPMYADADARATQIADLARHPDAWLRDRCEQASNALGAAFEDMEEIDWSAQVKTAQGRLVEGTELPWMRVRESVIHVVDLDCGSSFSDVPPDLIGALIDDVTMTLRMRDGCPQLVMTAAETGASWAIGPAVTGGSSAAGGPERREGPVEGAEVVAPAADLLAWVTGRAIPNPEWPALPPWI